MNKFKVIICNKEFSLQSEENPSYFIDLAKKVENHIMGMTRGNENVTVHHAALLSALSYADELKKANDSIDNIRTQIKEYVDDACDARNQCNEFEKKYNEISKREIELNNRIAELENQIESLKMQQNIDKQLMVDSKSDGKPKNKTNKF